MSERLSSCAWRIDHPEFEYPLFTIDHGQANAWIEQGVEVIALHGREAVMSATPATIAEAKSEGEHVPTEEHPLGALELTQSFKGNASETARALGVPRRVVVRAVLLVAAERDWLISLWETALISLSQRERLAVLLNLLPTVQGRPLRAADVRTTGQTRPEHVHLQCRGHVRVPGIDESSV